LENAIYGCYTNWDFSDRCSVSAASRRAVVELLLDHGAEVNYTNGIHMGRGTPLGSAAGSGQKWLVELLLARGAQVNVRDFYGRTPLMLAVERGYKDIVELLQAHNAEDTLFDAARVGDVETVKTLLDKNPELIRSSDENGKTALHYAARFGKKDIVELLLANKADINAKNKDGRTPLHQAAERSDGNLIELLLAHKAEINARDIHGITPLMLAAAEGSWGVLEVLVNKSDVNVTDDSGSAALHYAAGMGREEVAGLLMKYNADVNAKNNRGETPISTAMHHAIQPAKLIALLRQHGGHE